MPASLRRGDSTRAAAGPLLRVLSVRACVQVAGSQGVMPSATDVVSWSDGIEKGGIVFVLVVVIGVLGWVAWRNMKANEQRCADLERRNEELTDALFEATGLAERAAATKRPKEVRR